jgi:hypothetical protein
VARTWNRLVSLFVKEIRLTGMMGCVLACIWNMGEAARVAGSCSWDAQTGRSVATGGGGDRSMSLQDVAGTWNRLVSLFVKKIRLTGMMGCVLACSGIMGEAA